MSDVKLVGIVGSLRAGSVNAAAARAAVALVGDAASMTLLDVRDVPLYHGDEEEAGPPAPVLELREQVRAADGIVLFSPEYNTSLPAVTKNVIDWLSRDSAVWEGTAITMVTMSPGGRAGKSARDHFEAIMARQAPRLFSTVGFGGSADRLDEHGEISDVETLDELRSFLVDLASFCASAVDDG